MNANDGASGKEAGPRRVRSGGHGKEPEKGKNSEGKGPKKEADDQYLWKKPHDDRSEPVDPVDLLGRDDGDCQSPDRCCKGAHEGDGCQYGGSHPVGDHPNGRFVGDFRGSFSSAGSDEQPCAHEDKSRSHKD